MGHTPMSLVREDCDQTRPSGKLCDAWWPGWGGPLPDAPARPCWACRRAAFKGQGFLAQKGCQGPQGVWVPSLC